ncbi:MAG: methyltransferase, partial [Gammaproteobacteria bacterium]|nr:methyltransferase [Gammaproteobacteria bacterium]
MGRRSRRTRKNRGGSGIRQLPWRQPVNVFAPLEVLSADQVEQIHLASLTLLENYGMRVLHEGARKMLAQAGA